MKPVLSADGHWKNWHSDSSRAALARPNAFRCPWTKPVTPIHSVAPRDLIDFKNGYSVSALPVNYLSSNTVQPNCLKYHQLQ